MTNVNQIILISPKPCYRRFNGLLVVMSSYCTFRSATCDLANGAQFCTYLVIYIAMGR